MFNKMCYMCCFKRDKKTTCIKYLILKCQPKTRHIQLMKVKVIMN